MPLICFHTKYAITRALIIRYQYAIHKLLILYEFAINMLLICIPGASTSLLPSPSGHDVSSGNSSRAPPPISVLPSNPPVKLASIQKHLG